MWWDFNVIYDLADLLVALGILIGAVVGVFRTYFFIKKMICGLVERVTKLEETMEQVKHDIYDSTEERMILMRGMKATLEAVSQKKCNGNVTDAIEDIDDYLMVRGHEPKTKMRKRMEKEKEENEHDT